MANRAMIAGVGMVKFTTPSAGKTYDEVGPEAGRLALADAGLTFDEIQQAFVGYIYGDTCCGQRIVYQLGMTGIPIINVNNACASGSTALALARQAVELGAADCVLALGVEQMGRGALGATFQDRPTPLAEFVRVTEQVQGMSDAPPVAQLFGGAGREYMERYGARADTFGRIAVKARRHAALNPNAVFRDPVTLDEVMNALPIYGPLTRLQCCPPTTGAAAAIVCSEAFARRKGIGHAVAIRAQTLTTDFPGTFADASMMTLIGADMAKAGARAAYEMAGIGPEDIDVVELHDCFTANELITYEALGLTPEGTAEKFIADGDNTYGGRYVTNPSGGLLSKGHPIGATGLAQCAELVWHLRGAAGARQVENARLALQHNLGLGGACVVTIYEAA